MGLYDNPAGSVGISGKWFNKTTGDLTDYEKEISDICSGTSGGCRMS